jgi:hypothetical protein
LTSDGTTMGAGQTFCPILLLLGNGVLVSDGVLISDGVLVSDGVLISDGVLVSDTVLQAFNALTNGDTTNAMAVVPDDYTDYLGN